MAWPILTTLLQGVRDIYGISSTCLRARFCFRMARSCSCRHSSINFLRIRDRFACSRFRSCRCVMESAACVRMGDHKGKNTEEKIGATGNEPCP